MPGAEVEFEGLAQAAYRTGQTRLSGDADLVMAAAKVLESSDRPLILAGGGVVWSQASEEVIRMADVLGAPVITTYGHADAVPNGYERFLGHLGRLGSLEGIEAVRSADVILAVGTRLGQSSTFFDNRYMQSKHVSLKYARPHAPRGAFTAYD